MKVKAQKSAKKLARKKFKQAYNSEVNKPQAKKVKPLCNLDGMKMQLIMMYDRAHSTFRMQPESEHCNIFMDILKVAPLVDLDSTQQVNKKSRRPEELILDYNVCEVDSSFIPID